MISILLKVIMDMHTAYEMKVSPVKKLSMFKYLLHHELEKDMNHLLGDMITNHYTTSKLQNVKSEANRTTKEVYHKNMCFHISMN